MAAAQVALLSVGAGNNRFQFDLGFFLELLDRIENRFNAFTRTLLGNNPIPLESKIPGLAQFAYRNLLSS